MNTHSVQFQPGCFTALHILIFIKHLFTDYKQDQQFDQKSYIYTRKQIPKSKSQKHTNIFLCLSFYLQPLSVTSSCFFVCVPHTITRF